MIEDIIAEEEIIPQDISVTCGEELVPLFYNGLLIEEQEKTVEKFLSLSDSSFDCEKDDTAIEWQKRPWVDKNAAKSIAANVFLKSQVSENRQINQGSYYSEIKEYSGIIQDVHDTKFNVLFQDENDYINAEFDLADLQFQSDRDLIKRGALLVWLIGKERNIFFSKGKEKCGPQYNISRLIIRRVNNLSQKEKEEAEKNANEWAKLFRQ